MTELKMSFNKEIGFFRKSCKNVPPFKAISPDIDYGLGGKPCWCNMNDKDI